MKSTVLIINFITALIYITIQVQEIDNLSDKLTTLAHNLLCIKEFVNLNLTPTSLF